MVMSIVMIMGFVICMILNVTGIVMVLGAQCFYGGPCRVRFGMKILAKACRASAGIVQRLEPRLYHSCPFG